MGGAHCGQHEAASGDPAGTPITFFHEMDLQWKKHGLVRTLSKLP